MQGVKFYTFPRPVIGHDEHPKTIQCKKWIKHCGRPHHQLNVDKIHVDTLSQDIQTDNRDHSTTPSVLTQSNHSNCGDCQLTEEIGMMTLLYPTFI